MSLTKKKKKKSATNKQIRYSSLITGCPLLKISKFWFHNRSPYHFLPWGRRRTPLQERRGCERGQVPGERKRKENTSTRRGEEGRGRGREVWLDGPDYPLKNENPEEQWQKLKARELWEFPLFPVLYFRKGQPYKTTTPNKGLLQTQ